MRTTEKLSDREALKNEAPAFPFSIEIIVCTAQEYKGQSDRAVIQSLPRIPNSREPTPSFPEKYKQD